MKLYLFRHGIAEDTAPGGSDADRRLTSEGRSESASVARLARRAGARPSLIASSPYVRAVQTAEAAANEFGWKGEVVRLQSLVPHGRPEDVWNDVRSLKDEPELLLAGHEPLMGHLAAYFLNAPGLTVNVKKSAMLRIDFAGFGTSPRGELRWMIVPKLASDD